MKKVLVIGNGKRVQGGILPALSCMKEHVEVVAVYSRSVGFSLDGIDFRSLDLIVVAVTTSQVPTVLDLLKKYPTQHLTLMLDTPVLRMRDMLAARHFTRFKKVLATEDTIALPPFRLARSLIGEGRIGAVKNICLFHSGYKYHALASLKMLAGKRSIVAIRSRKLFDGITVKNVRFSSGLEATIFEPRDYGHGSFMIEGEQGIITDYEHKGEHVLRIGYITENDLYRGLTLDGAKVPEAGLDKQYLKHISSHLPHASLMNSMKIRALMDLFEAALEEVSPFQYPVNEAMSDSVAISISELGYYHRLPGNK